MEISDIKDEKSLREWLAEKPDEWAHVVAARMALRVAPMAFSEAGSKTLPAKDEYAHELICLTFRANFINVAARKYPAEDMHAAFAFAADAANAAALAANAADLAVDAAARVAVRAAAFAFAFAVDAAGAADAAAFAASAATDANDFPWESIREDCRWLEREAIARVEGMGVDLQMEFANSASAVCRDLMAEPLWDAGEMPGWVSRELDIFRKSELAKTTYFGFIADWYSAALVGNSAFGEKADIAIAKMSPKDWGDEDEKRDCIAVMDRVAKLAGWERPDIVEEIAGEVEQEGAEILIPPVQPAALEPEWLNGKLTIPDRAASDDYSGGDINAALLALRNLLLDFCDVLEDVPNVDRRFLEYFRNLAKDAPTEMPA